MRMFRLAAGIFFTVCMLAGFAVTTGAQEEKGSRDSSGTTIAGVLADVKSIWPFGKCAENIVGDKKFVLFSFACKDNFTAFDRRTFLNKMTDRGWQLRREDYHIDKNNAAYFYKFQVDLDHDVYIKLFFRDPLIVWPLHENVRPKIIVFLNDVREPDEIQKWTELKLPLTVSVSLSSQKRDTILETSRKMNFDTWLFLPDSLALDTAAVTEPGESGNTAGQVQDSTKVGDAQNEVSKDSAVSLPVLNLHSLVEVLHGYPDQQFPFSGLSLSGTNPNVKHIERLRSLFKLMKKEGLKRFVAPVTPEITDTAKILDLVSAGHTYYLGQQGAINEAAWHNAYENSKSNGYSVIILDARNIEARNFLLKMIQETISFVDYTTLEHVY